jgi:hypothetical protein
VSGEAQLLLATDAASEGLNLHHRCRLVINLELPWTPTRLEQRIGRVERLGQTRRVHAVHLLGAGTCEEDSVAVLMARLQRADGVLSRIRSSVCEQEIAAVAIGQQQTDLTVHVQNALPDGIVTGDLRATGIEEAARLEHVRTLVEGGHESVDGRPCVAVRRRRRARPVNDWAYRVMFEDSALQPVWSTLIGLREASNLGSIAHEAIRRRIDSLCTTTEPALDTITTRLFSSVRAALAPSHSLAEARERAIAEGLRVERARLATSLLQPGLFDRRAERAAAAQYATLDEALDRCSHRLEELAREDSIAVDRRLALGLVAR